MTHEEKLEFLDRKWKATLSNEYWKEVERLAKLKGITYNIKHIHSLMIILAFLLEQKVSILFWSIQRVLENFLF